MGLQDGSERRIDVRYAVSSAGDLARGLGRSVESLESGDAQGLGRLVRGEEGCCAGCALREGGVGGDEGEEDGCEGYKSEGFVEGREKGGAEAGEVQPDVVQVGDGCAIGFEGGGPPCNVNATGEGVPEQYVGNDGKDGEVNGRREGPSLDKIAVGLDNDHHHQNCAGDGTSSGDDGIPGKSTNY